MVLVNRPAANTKFVRKEERKDQVVTAPGRKVKGLDRHRAGKAKEADGEESDDELVVRERGTKEKHKVEQKVDRRLERMQQHTATGTRRHIHAEVIEEPTEQPEQQQQQQQQQTEEDDFEERRAKARMMRAPSPDTQGADINNELNIETEEEEEYEEVTESEEEEAHTYALSKPVYIAKQQRNTHLEQRKREVEKQELVLKKQAIAEKRREDTKRMVIEDKKQQEAAANNEAESDGELPDDNDDLDPTMEFTRWENREMKRMVRYRDQRDKEEAEKREVLRRRLLSDDARKQENIDYDKLLRSKGLRTDKVKRNFMQKHYHMGGFFQDTEEKGLTKEAIYNRDIDHAVGADRFNKELLSGAQQVRGDEFGKKGQTKWTHLTNEDTTYQKDRHGEMLENAFVTTTFASNKATMSANQAHQASENHLMFRHAKASETTPLAPGSSQYGSAGVQHKDYQLSRPSKRKK
eukprot:TRINITY_DN3977_c0_g4_i1.p1 TRINITY_DN3977_c0_g4~~TRINITY_DN3977_c0_g4_i1.p1  ORF type:complete len:465 (+),score=151.29 TRINITY_DN3977_c0_g4_i1:52-1446(+)